MAIQPDSSLTLRQTAAELNIEPWRMARLGRYLRIDADDKCVPRTEIDRARGEVDADGRYMVILHWLLGEFRTRHERAGA